jgi:sirohydrochlorin ferrochelatase
VTLIAVAHGTRSASGQSQIHDLVTRVARRRPFLDLRVSYVDVQRPRLSDVTAGLHRPAVVVPLLLTTGYHVRVDIARGIAGIDAVATAPLGAGPELVDVLADRIAAAGPADAVVLAAAGSSDARSQAEVAAVARALPGNTRIGYAATSAPRVPEVVAGLRAEGAERVVIAAYLLVDGLFYRSLHRAGADHVTAPLITHPGAADIVLHRYDQALLAARLERDHRPDRPSSGATRTGRFLNVLAQRAVAATL